MSFNCFSFSSALGSSRDGRNEGISVGGGEGDGERCSFAGLDAAVGPVVVEGAGGDVELELEFELESEDSESDPELDDSSTVLALGTVLIIFDGVSSSEDDESELDDELDDDAARLLRFLVRFLGAGFAALAGGIGRL